VNAYIHSPLSTLRHRKNVLNPFTRNSRLMLGKSDDDVSNLRVKEIKEELESVWGVSTASFVEKSELVDALLKARRSSKGDRGSSSKKSSSKKSSQKSPEQSKSDRIAEQIKKCENMRVGELKKELKKMGIKTTSFFEKSEFVRALAEARVDAQETAKNSGGGADEKYDSSYRDVVMQKFNGREQRIPGLIDIQLG